MSRLPHGPSPLAGEVCVHRDARQTLLPSKERTGSGKMAKQNMCTNLETALVLQQHRQPLAEFGRVNAEAARKLLRTWKSNQAVILIA